MNIEAAKKRSINGIIETHYRNIRLRGKIKFFDAAKGYGFMHCSDKQERFFHISDTKGITLEAGELVNLIGIHTKRGPRAVQIVPAVPLKFLEYIKFTFFDNWGQLCGDEDERLKNLKKAEKQPEKKPTDNRMAFNGYGTSIDADDDINPFDPIGDFGAFGNSAGITSVYD